MSGYALFRSIYARGTAAWESLALADQGIYSVLAQAEHRRLSYFASPSPRSTFINRYRLSTMTDGRSQASADAARERELRELHARMQRLNEGLEDLTSAAKARMRRASMPADIPFGASSTSPHSTNHRDFDPYANNSPHYARFPDVFNMATASENISTQEPLMTSGYRATADITRNIYADMERMAQKSQQASSTQYSMKPPLHPSMSGELFTSSRTTPSTCPQSFSSMSGSSSSMPFQPAKSMMPGHGDSVLPPPSHPWSSHFAQSMPYNAKSPFGHGLPQAQLLHPQPQQHMQHPFAMRKGFPTSTDTFGRSAFPFPSPFAEGGIGVQSHFDACPIAPAASLGIYGMQFPDKQQQQYHSLPITQPTLFGNLYNCDAAAAALSIHEMHKSQQHAFTRRPSPFGAF